MTWSEAVVIVVAVLAVVIVVVWRTATRLDRLHRKVVASRIALDAQLVRRAGAAHALAISGVLDPVSSLVLADAVVATDAAQGGRELAVALPDLAGFLRRDQGAASDAELLGAPGLLGGDALVHGDAPGRAIGQALAEGMPEERTQAESNLSAALRAVLADADDVAELAATEDGAALLGDLAAAWSRVHLARRFHNEAVAQAQRMRAKAGVRLLHLAGRAPMPQMVELDDVWPVELVRPGRGQGDAQG